ncbi:MAG: TetR/AcrR family transcriptional regulator [Brevinematales bacterium]|jgi:AcrR family transcriptional regulator
MTDSRDQILAVAYELFLQKSYKEVSIQEIASRVGMTKGAFYYFFKSKEQLYQEIFNSFFIIELRKDFAEYSHESLYKFYHDYFTHIVDQEKENKESHGKITVNTYAFLFDALKHFPDFQVWIKGYFQEEKKSWVEIIKTSRDKGEIKSPMSDEQIADVFISTGDSLGMRGIVIGGWIGLKESLIELWDAFYECLKK